MKRFRAGLLIPFLLLAGCGGFLSTASRTITTTSSAIESAARTGALIHKKEVEQLVADVTKKREALGCGTDPSFIPSTCDRAKWVVVRNEFVLKFEAALARYEKFKNAVLTADASVAIAADALLAYKNNKDKANLMDVLERLVRAYRLVIDVLNEWGVETALPTL